MLQTIRQYLGFLFVGFMLSLCMWYIFKWFVLGELPEDDDDEPNWP